MMRIGILMVLAAGILWICPADGFADPVSIADGGTLLPEFLWSRNAVGRMLDDLASAVNAEEPAAAAESRYLQQGESGYKSPGRAFFLSLLVPGMGEIYSGSKRGLAFLGLEAFSWGGYLHYNGKGKDERTAYEAFADLHYHRDQYESVVNEICGKYLSEDPDWPCPTCEYEYCAEDLTPGQPGYSENQCEMVRGHFILPDQKGQHYYEDLGKYDKYIFGWDDWYDAYNPHRGEIYWTTWKPGEPWPTTLPPWDTTIGMTSAYREEYREMRRKSNDYLDRASYFTWFVLINHVGSALDAAFTAREHNRRLAGDPPKFDVGLDTKPLEDEFETRIFLRRSF